MTESTKVVDRFAPATPPKPVVVTEVPDVETLEVSANPGQIQWPTDRWGYTSKFKKEFMLAAGTISGQDDKQVLMLSILDIMRGHLIARLAKDKAARVKFMADALKHAAERNSRDHRAKPK